MTNLNRYPILFFLLFTSINSVIAQETVNKHYCLSAVGSQDIDTLKKKLVASVKREAVNEIFGELITSFTKIDRGLLTEDKLKLASIGYIRIKGNPFFKNGTSFGEVCVSVNAYANDEDKKKFEPVKINNKYCATNSDFTTRQIKEYAKDQSIITALTKHNRNLDKYSDDALLKLLHEIEYIETGFIPETETYCSKIRGVFYPVELVVTLNGSVTGSTHKKTKLLKSCKDIYEINQKNKDGIYEVDVDGEKGKIKPFKVYCNMTEEGGGWTLFANHADGLSSIQKKEIVNRNNYGVMEDDKWKSLRNNMSEGMMFIDESGRVSTISATKLNRGKCTAISSVNDLSNAGMATYNSAGGIWHDENSGCNIRGGDYSMIQIRGNSYKYYKLAGAALYQQSSLKFDKWPYRTDGASYEEQNKLQYYIK